ncbi:MAG: hypothetical protein DWQ29_12275 [Planctomycetota bacterium]|nr:MAG: hypothetical protein DWQ29_12275 [Planctomycetota bacterium]
MRMPDDPRADMRRPEAGESVLRHWLMRRVTCPNPFYLLSAACVIHATGVPLESYADALSPEALLAVIGGYAAILAAVACLIVRLWKVWDDARSIFMILLLLFLEMALCADSLVQDDPLRAARLLAVGFAAAVGVSEFLLHTLRLRLPALFRIPYYLQLALLFLYPFVLLPSLRAHDGAATTWGIFAFPFLVGLTGLSLWPAMRRGPDAVRDNGSPWVWGWYPWTLFVFLGFCLCLRSYTLCLSFDAATALGAAAAYRLESIFGAYFLAPVLFAAAVLLLEAGLQSSHRTVLRIALWLPVVVVALSFPGSGRNAADAQFISRLLDTVGSPVWWSLMTACVFYGVAALRGAPGARRFTVYSIAALAVIDRESTVDWNTLTAVQPWPLFAAALLAGVAGFRSRRSGELCEALVFLAIGAVAFDSVASLPIPRELVVCHIVLISMLTVGVLLDDGTARMLRKLGVAALMVAAALTCLHSAAVSAAAWVTPVYVGGVTLVIACVVWLRPSGWLKAALCIQLVAVYAGLIVQGCQLLQRSVRGQGGPSFLMAVVLLHFGLLLSALKAGALQRFAQRLLGSDDERAAGES